MPLVSKIPPRTRDVTEADFDELELFGGVKNRCDVTSRFLNAWNEAVPILPQDFLGIVMSYVDDDTTVTLRNHSKLFDIELYSSKLHTKYFDCSYALFEGKPKTQSANLEIPAAHRSTGLGACVGAMLIDIDVAMRLPYRSVDAALDRGAHHWPKVGYETYEKNWSHNLDLSSILKSKIEAVKPFLTEDGIFETAMAHAALNKGKDICHLARMDFDLSVLFDDTNLDEKVFPILHHSLLNAFNSSSKSPLVTKREQNIQTIVRLCKNAGKPLTLGEYTLAGETVRVRADFSNDGQMGQVIRNLGGVKHSHIVPINH